MKSEHNITTQGTNENVSLPLKHEGEDIATISSYKHANVKVKKEQETKQAIPIKSCLKNHPEISNIHSRKRGNASMIDRHGERARCKPLKRVKTERNNSNPSAPAVKLTDGTLPISHNGADNTSSAIDLTSSPDDSSLQLKAEESHSNYSNTHVIFAFDCSKSMKTADVRTDKGTISRWDAVFKCVDSFLNEQVQKHGSEIEAHCYV